MYDSHYTWGQSTEGTWANLLTYAQSAQVGTSADQATDWAVAEEYLHYFHGRNPLSMTYPDQHRREGGTGLGADKSPMGLSLVVAGRLSTLRQRELALRPGTGYVVGGPNQFFTRTWISPPSGEPAMRAFRSWNAVWNEDPSGHREFLKSRSPRSTRKRPTCYSSRNTP